jgi:signal transduction histidine kinase
MARALLPYFNLATQLAFILLALGTLADWIRNRDRQRAFLVLALVALTGLVVINPLAQVAGLPAGVATDIALVDFLLSGYFLLLFRDSLIPLGAAPRLIITIALAAVAVAAMVAGLPSNPGETRSPFQVAALAAVVVAWILCVAEPIFRLGVASIGRPAVEGARLRALSLGYAGLVGVIIVAFLGGSGVQNPNVGLALDVVVLVIVPLLYASFSPPVWLRRLWSQPEDEEIRRALHDLLLYSPDRMVLAHRALDWAVRLVGGASAFIVDSDGSILASRGITPEEANHIASSPDEARSTIVVPLDLQQGKGSMTIVSGPFTPVFGEWEINRLRSYAVSIIAGLDRVLLTERIAELEKAKSDFLNLASHELRGPMTIIKGYLTMLAAGTLGDMPPKAVSVMPLLIAKSDEITSLVEQMIEASRLEEGRLALRKERADIVDLTSDAIANIQPTIADRELKFDRPSRSVFAEVDPDRYHIVIRNLISNAVKYSPAGSDILVRMVTNHRVAKVEVVDWGIGIKPEDQLKLFTRFGRVENPETMHTPGTGLGLWLSREIARMHDGDLTLESEAGKGSTFTLEIPVES